MAKVRFSAIERGHVSGMYDGEYLTFDVADYEAVVPDALVKAVLRRFPTAALVEPATAPDAGDKQDVEKTGGAKPKTVTESANDSGQVDVDAPAGT